MQTNDLERLIVTAPPKSSNGSGGLPCAIELASRNSGRSPAITVKQKREPLIVTAAPPLTDANNTEARDRRSCIDNNGHNITIAAPAELTEELRRHLQNYHILHEQRQQRSQHQQDHQQRQQNARSSEQASAQLLDLVSAAAPPVTAAAASLVARCSPRTDTASPDHPINALISAAAITATGTTMATTVSVIRGPPSSTYAPAPVSPVAADARSLSKCDTTSPRPQFVNFFSRLPVTIKAAALFCFIHFLCEANQVFTRAIYALDLSPKEAWPRCRRYRFVSFVANYAINVQRFFLPHFNR